MSERSVAAKPEVARSIPSAQPAEPGGVTAEALIALPEMMTPSVSPDGLWIAWTWLGRDPVACVYVAPTDGSASPRRITSGPFDAVVESWSADSRQLILALTDGGDEKVRLHLAPVENGGPLRLLTDAAPDYYITGGDLHPSGRWLVYAANLDDAGQAIEATWIHRHDIETGARTVLARPRCAVDHRPRLNPWGTHVVYGRSDRHPAGRTVWLVDIDGKVDEEIVAFGDTETVGAFWSPDGGQLVVVHEMKDRIRIGLWGLSDRRLRWLIDDPKRSIVSARWPAGSNDILVEEVTETVPRFTLLDPATGIERAFVEKLKPLAPVGGGRWAARHGHARQPLEIVTFPADDPQRARSLSSLWEATHLRPSDLVAAEDFRWRSVDGLAIQGWLYRASGRAAGAVIVVHGGPALHYEDEFDPLIQHLVAQGLHVLTPNYRGSTGFGMAFQEAIKTQGWGGLEQEDIRTGALALIAAGLAEPGRIGITGLSYGGYSSWWAITHFPRDVIAAAAPVCGMTDLVIDYEMTRPDLRPFCEDMMGGSPSALPELYRERSPINFIGNIEGRLLIVQGLRDPNVTPENMRTACRALDALGKDYELLNFEDEGHGIYKPKNRLVLHRRLADFFLDALAAKNCSSG